MGFRPHRFIIAMQRIIPTKSNTSILVKRLIYVPIILVKYNYITRAHIELLKFGTGDGKRKEEAIKLSAATLPSAGL